MVMLMVLNHVGHIWKVTDGKRDILRCLNVVRTSVFLDGCRTLRSTLFS